MYKNLGSIGCTNKTHGKLLQEDRSGNSYAGGNGHTAKIVRFNKLTGDVYEEKPTFGTSQSTFRAAKIKCKKDNLLVLL